nr:MAG TPA: hypothetical protein [Caudoviricetes sp.]
MTCCQNLRKFARIITGIARLLFNHCRIFFCQRPASALVCYRIGSELPDFFTAFCCSTVYTL